MTCDFLYFTQSQNPLLKQALNPLQDPHSEHTLTLHSSKAHLRGRALHTSSPHREWPPSLFTTHLPALLQTSASLPNASPEVFSGCPMTTAIPPSHGPFPSSNHITHSLHPWDTCCLRAHVLRTSSAQCLSQVPIIPSP